MRLSSEQAFDELAQKIDIDGFGYISIEAGGFRAGAKVYLLMSGDGDDGNAAQSVNGADLLRSGQAIKDGQAQVHKDDVGILAFRHFYSPGAVFCFNYQETQMLQREPHEIPGIIGVFDD